MAPPARQRNFKPSVPPPARPLRRIQTAPTFRRPATHHLTSLIGGDNVVRLDLPHGCFNAGLAALPAEEGYVCVYRPDESSFTAAFLDKYLQLDSTKHRPLGISNCADPRLVWIGDELLMIYSSYDTGSYKTECIRGAVIGRARPDFQFIKPRPFRVSLPGAERQKNWTPFVMGGGVYLVASVKPHLVYELRGSGCFATPCCEAEWDSPWFSPEFFRGNTNAVQIDPDTFLGTFHTVIKNDRMHYYDNGCYTFEARPPFRVLRCSTRTFLPAEAATEPHFRKSGQIKVCFPVGMVLSKTEPDKLLISYGDNDSSVKILKTTVAEMLATTVELY